MRAIHYLRLPIHTSAMTVVMPAIAVTIVSDEELSHRTLGGEFEGDIEAEHTSFIWFLDRAGHRRARMIARGILGGCVASEVECLRLVDLSGGVMVKLSTHHVESVSFNRDGAMPRGRPDYGMMPVDVVDVALIRKIMEIALRDGWSLVALMAELNKFFIEEQVDAPWVPKMVPGNDLDRPWGLG